MLKKLIIGILALALLSCGRIIKVSEIEKGQNLETASENSVNEFFIKRMSNKTRKTEAISWQILFQNNEYVYFGFPKQKNETDEIKTITELFKVKRSELLEQFPGYETITGESVGYNLYIAIEEYRKKTDTPPFEIASLSWSAALTKDSIVLTAICQIKSGLNTNTETYWIEFDKKNFNLIQVKKI